MLPDLSRLRSLGFWERLALSVWIASFLFVSIRAAVNPHRHSVYPIFASAAWHWLEGASLYQDQGEPYRYSPLATVLLVPFGCLPDWLGGLLWRLVNGGVYLSALAWWCRVALPHPLTRAQLAGLFLLIVPASVGSLNNGQSNALVLGLLLAALAGAAQERWNWTSGCLALACLFKVYPLAVGLLLVLLYPRRLATRLALALGAGLIVPFLLQQPGYVWTQYADWLACLRAEDRHSLIKELWYRDIRLLFHTFGLTINPGTYFALQLGGAALIAAFCLAVRRAGREPRRLLLLLCALACSWMTVLGSAAESCTYILLAPVLAWGLLDAWTQRQPFWLQAFLWSSYALFLSAEVAVWSGQGRSYHALGIHPLAALLFLAHLLIQEFRLYGQRRRARLRQLPHLPLLPGPTPIAGR
jgi:hypothetical protein